MVCANLVRLGYWGTIVLIERGPRPARGVAYDPPSERLLLNVPAANMGAWADDPSEFHRWLVGRGREVGPGAFVSRAWYGEYLEQKLREAVDASRGRLSVVRGEAAWYSKDAGSQRVVLVDGREIVSSRLVLALGISAPGRSLVCVFRTALVGGTPIRGRERRTRRAATPSVCWSLARG